MYLIRKRFTFEAAHQLEPGIFTSACSDCIHGHSYTVELILDSLRLNKHGMVVDFGGLKEFKDQVMVLWDHGLILHENKREWFAPLIASGILKESKVSFLSWNPTAETMAKILYETLTGFVQRKGWIGVSVRSVRVHETANGWAEYKERVV